MTNTGTCSRFAGPTGYCIFAHTRTDTHMASEKCNFKANCRPKMKWNSPEHCVQHI